MSSMLMLFFIAALIGYFVGSIPFGFILSQAAGFGDIRKIGSGSTGATNVLRTGNKKIALLTVVLDILKITLVVYVLSFYSIQLACVAGVFAVIGHNYPVWLGFKGGKGFAGTLGFLFAVSPALFLISILEWLLIAFITRISSASAIAVLITMPFVALALRLNYIIIISLVILSVLGIFQHRANLKRLLNGKESKIKL